MFSFFLEHHRLLQELQELVEEREELVKAIAELQARLEQIAVSNKANCKADWVDWVV